MPSMYLESPTSLKDLFNPRYIHFLWEIAKENGAMQKFDYTEKYAGNQEHKVAGYASLESRFDWTAEVEGKPGFFQAVATELDLSTLVSQAEQGGFTAFSQAKGFRDCKYFIVKSNVPDEFVFPVMLHEIVESKLIGVGECCVRYIYESSGEDVEEGLIDAEDSRKWYEREMAEAKLYPHKSGCIAEIQSAFDKGREFAERHADWIMRYNGNPDNQETWFNQIYPQFLSRSNRLTRSPIEAIVEFYIAINNMLSDDIDRVKEELVKKWQWITPFIPAKTPEEKLEE